MDCQSVHKHEIGWLQGCVTVYLLQLHQYLNTLDVSRYKAESVSAFKQYFDVVSSKIDQYGIQPQNMYNIDGKGFLICYLTKSKRVFTKTLFESG